MVFSKQLTTSLLTEHFTYTPLTLIDDIIDTINALVYTNISGIETALLSVSPVTLGFEKRAAAAAASDGAGTRPETDENGNPMYPEASQEIEEGVQKLETLLEATVDKNFDKLEIAALRTILNVPEGLEGWVRLSHYEISFVLRTELLMLHPPNLQGLDFAPRPDAPTPESIHLLRRKLQETRKLEALLLAERSRNAALIAQLRAMFSPTAKAKPSSTSPPTKFEHTDSDSQDPAESPQNFSFAFLSAAEGARALGVKLDGGAADEQHPLTTNTRFALSQIPALRELITTLRPYIGSLPSATLDAGEAGKRTEERITYLDGRVRRGLERRGLLREGGVEDRDVGIGSGALRRKVGRDEVRSLERIVEGFGVPGSRRRAANEDEMEE